MKEVQVKALESAVRLLEAAGVKYAIRTDDGGSYGTLEVVEARKKAPCKYPHGSLATHIRPFIMSMQVGDVSSIPVTPFDPETLASSVASICSKTWGNKNHTACITKDRTAIEVLRLG